MRFSETLRECSQSGKVPVIPDLKMISPAAGELFADRNVIEVAKTMEVAGAPTISVVTERNRFGGSLELLSQLAEAVQIPILRKDFIGTKEDVEESIRAGASAVLLIASCMSETKLLELYTYALETGIEPLVETHTEEQLRYADKIGAKLVGINNRDILAWECDEGNVDTTAELAVAKPWGAFLVSESGIQNREDVHKAIRSGADAVLVGTAIWKAKDPFAFYRELTEGKGCAR